jgi:NAD(P)-dependent dehydrogenase (short-subunit alcohol dehydrogenase family)
MEQIALVTGANRGIGFEVSRQLAKRGIITILSGRDLEATQNAAKQLSSDGLITEALELDVSDDDQIELAAAFIKAKFEKLDILVNNGAVYLDEGRSIFNLPIDAFRTTLDINLVGPFKLSQTLIPLLRRSPAARIVNVSSGMGALNDMGGRDAAYRISKAALNALTRIIANELRGTPAKVNAVCPGWVRTEMGGSGASRSVVEGAEGIVWAATLPDDGPTGGFYRDGRELDW